MFLFPKMVDIDMSCVPRIEKIPDIISKYLDGCRTESVIHNLKSDLLSCIINANKHRYPKIDISKIEINVLLDEENLHTLKIEFLYNGDQIHKMDEDGFILLEENE